MERVQKELLDFNGFGISVMECSHRQPEFLEMSRRLETEFREVMKVPDNWRVFLINGGATLQFSAIPFNLCSHIFGKQEAAANFLETG
jgi:phosphoserine aminotransferase